MPTEAEETIQDTIKAVATELEEKGNASINDPSPKEAPAEPKTAVVDDKTPKEGEKQLPTPTAKQSEDGGSVPEGDKVATEENKILTEDKAPRGWSPASREKWSTIPEDLRKEILRREEATAVGVRQLQERYAPFEGFARSLAPLIQEASSLGVSPTQYLGSLAQTERILRTAEMPARFNELLRVADQYGIPLRDIINKSVGQEVIPAKPPQQPQQPQLPPEIIQELQEMRAWRQSVQTGGVNTEIAEFAKDKEFFNDVHMVMAGMFESGMANTLQEAYDAACWANPQIRAVMKEREALKSKQSDASGASLKPNGQVDTGTSGEEDEDDLHAMVRKQWNQSVSGRL